MNVAYFILVVTVLSFATGLFVAAIIWVIKWSILPKENSDASGIKELIRFFKKLSEVKKQTEQYAFSVNQLGNKELYRYYHGLSAGHPERKDVHQVESLNKERYQYYHGKN